MNITRKQKFRNTFPILIMGLCSIFLFIRCFFSFSWTDESYYLTVAHRFWLGERMFADEWYTTQLSTPLLLPFYALYQWISGGNEGIYLYFRLVYWSLSTFTAFFTYITLKKFNSCLSAFFCALIYLFYSRANIGGMSYYNMTLTFVLLGTLLIYEQLQNNQMHKIKLFLSGILFALAVVVTPFLTIPYVLIAGTLLFLKKNHATRKNVLFAILGTGTAAFFYLIYVFTNVSIDEILLNIPRILNEPGLQKTNPILAIPLMFIRIIWRYKWTFLPYICLLIYILYKRRKTGLFSQEQFKSINITNFLIFIVNFYFSSDLLGCINIALVLFGLPLMIYYKNWDRNIKTIIQSFGISGFSVVFSFTFSSNTGLDAMSIGFVILSMGMVLLLFQNGNLSSNKLLHFTLTTVVAITILQTAFLRLVSVYRDAPLIELNTQITSGPAKYLYTTSEHAEQYYSLKNDIATFVRRDDKIFYSKNCFWGYLCTENEYGVPSSWRMGMDNPRLEEYYTLNPEKVPTCIFVLKPEYGNFESSLIQNNEKVDRPNENHLEGYLYDYIIENNYEIIDAESSMIFRKK